LIWQLLFPLLASRLAPVPAHLGPLAHKNFADKTLARLAAPRDPLAMKGRMDFSTVFAALLLTTFSLEASYWDLPLGPALAYWLHTLPGLVPITLQPAPVWAQLLDIAVLFAQSVAVVVLARKLARRWQEKAVVAKFRRRRERSRSATPAPR
jgi:hypothetical protein